MKKSYESPTAEKVDFQYKDHVVASNQCLERWTHSGVGICQDNPQTSIGKNNL